MSFNPANAQLIGEWEDAGVGIPPESFGKGLPFSSEDLSGEQSLIESATIEADAQMSEPERGKYPIQGDTVHELIPEDHAWLLAAAQKKASVVNPEGTVSQHKLAPSESAITMPETYSLVVNRDDGMPVGIHGIRPATISLALAPDSYGVMTVTHMAEHFGYWSPPTESVPGATPATVNPALRGLPDYDSWVGVAAAGSVHIQVSSVANSPDEVSFFAKVGDASAFGAIETVVKAGKKDNGQPYWTELLDSTSGRVIGSIALAVEVAVTDMTGYEVGDEWTWSRERSTWVQSTSGNRKLTEVAASILLGDDEIKVEGVTLTMNFPASPYMTIGDVWACEISDRGQRRIAPSIDRRYVDLDLKKRLERAESFGLTVSMFAEEYIGSTAHQPEISFIMPKIVLAGRSPVVGGQEDMQESMTGTAHPDPGNVDGYVDDLTIEVVNETADLSL